MNFVNVPNLPQNAATVIVSADIPEDVLENLHTLGIDIIFAPRLADDINPIINHPDVGIVHINSKKFVCSPETYEHYLTEFSGTGADLICGNTSIIGKYPKDSAYNIARVSSHIFMNAKNVDGVLLDNLEDILDCYFYVLFRKVIPDNGQEFTDFTILETSIHKDLNKRLDVHYTHTYSSYEKPHIENNHILLRWLISKGYDITNLTSDNIIDIINRLNNYPRKKLDYKTPLQALEEELGDYILDLLNLYHIPISELNMKDMIINNT